MSDITGWIGEKVTAFLTWFMSLLGVLLQTMWDALKDALLYVIDTLLGIAISLIGVIDFSALSNFTASQLYAQLPAEMVQVLALIRLGEAMGIVIGSLVIATILRLIPFVRLGN